ncbi:MAG: PKD domain-containing protein, partial [Bacteroidota bacterium]
AGSSSFFWEFGDTKTSTLQNPENIYTSAGTFTVNFRESSGGPVVGSITINVYPDPAVALEVDTTFGCAPLTVTLTDISTVDPNVTIDGYRWVFGDGETMTTFGGSVVHVYDNAGTFNPSLQLLTSLPSCNTSAVTLATPIVVTEVPVIGFTTTPNPPLACDPPFEVTFTNVTPNPVGLNFEWDFDNGNTFSGQNPPAQTYTEDGNYQVVLTATDGNGCEAQFTRTVSVGNPLANFVIPDTLCIDVPTQIINRSSAGTYSWNFGPNAIPMTSTEESPLVRFTQAGTYDITLSVVAPVGGCMGDTTITIVVDEVDPSFTLAPDYSCTAPFDVTFTPNTMIPGATFSWQFGDDSTSTEENPTHTYMDRDPRRFAFNGPDTFRVVLTVTNPSGCSATSSEVVVLHQPEAAFVPDRVSGCAPLEVVFADSSRSNENITNWMWFYGDGNMDNFNSSQNPTNIYQDPGTYEAFLVITNAAGCMDTSYIVTIEVGGPLDIDFTADRTEVCPGDSVRLTGINNTAGVQVDGWHFETDNSRSFHCFQDSTVDWAYFTEAGQQDVTLYAEYNGCISEVTRNDFITVNGPIARIDYEVFCEQPFNYVFRDSSSDATMVTWDFGDGSMPISGSPINHVFPDTGNYTVVLTAENAGNGCPASVDSVTVFVRDVKASFMLDTILCQGQEYMLDAIETEGAVADCWRGYTWKFAPEINRPITTQDSVIPFTFNDTGRYQVTLIALDINGCRDTSDISVKVFRSEPLFEVDKDTICLPSVVTFTNLSTSDTTITKYEWDFGDGQTFEGETPPPHTYNVGSVMDSIITVTLQITDAAGCGSTFSLDIFVYQPMSEIIASDTTICVGDMVDFTATDFTDFGSSLIYNWDFGNSQTSTNQNFTATYPNSGNFTVNLTFEEIATGCQGTTSTNISVQEFPDADFVSSLDNNPNDCAPQIVDFTDNSTTNNPPLSYLWSFGPNIRQGPAITLTLPRGDSRVFLEVATSNGCLDTISKVYTLKGPEANIVADQPSICSSGGTVTFNLENQVDVGNFSWDLGDGTVVDNQAPVTHTYGNINASEVVVRVVLTDNSGECDLTDSITLRVDNLGGDFVVGDETCTGAPVDFTFTGSQTTGVTFDWDFGDETGSEIPSPSHEYTAAGTYDVRLIITDGACIDTIQRTIEVGETPSPSIDGGVSCNGDPITLTATGTGAGSTLLWGPAINLESGAVLTDQTVRTSILAGSEVITLTETSPLGCVGTAQFTTSVINDEIELPDSSFTVCPGMSQVIYGQPLPGFTYSFSPSEGTDSSNLSIMVDLEVGERTTYTLTATPTGTTECPSTQATITIETDETPVRIPNAFTPNSDRNNDYFNYVITNEDFTGQIEVQRFQVFNRWGKLVYDNDDPDRGWSGFVDGELSPSDVYIYLIEMDIEGCPTELRKGDVTLIR